MPTILNYRDDAPRTSLGGKAWALQELGAAGFPVPEWFVVAPTDFEAYRSRMGAPEGIAFPADFLQALEGVLETLGGTRFAVRSSACDEDGADHSFAGQLDSFLFVLAQDVPARIVDVWRSAFGERIRAYRAEKGLGDPVPPAVLVQRMIDSESAGVAFSADPIRERWGTCLVSAVPGLGTALVGGEGDADGWEVDREGRIAARAIAVKRTRHAFDARAAEGVSAVAVAEDIASTPVLEDGQVLEVAALARECARHFGRPQDIEWAFQDGRLFLLQSRPITTLGRQPDPDGLKALWDNSNIAESYAGITTPLTYTFARRAYEAVYREFCRLMGVSERAIEEHDGTFRCMIGLVKGRVYYNLLAWYRVLALFPGFRANRRFMEQMMGVKEGLPEDLARELEKGSRILDALRLAGTIAGLVKAHWTLPRQIRAFYQQLEEALKEPAVPFHLQRPEELIKGYRDLESRMITRWDAPLVNDFLAMIFFGVLRSLCQKWCGDTDGTLVNDLVGGEGGLVSAEPAARVREMAALARRDSALAECLRTASWTEIARELEKHPELKRQFEAYVQRFGDRCLEELKLESSTLHDDPLPVLRAVGHFASRLESQHADHSTKARMEAEKRVGTRLSGIKKAFFTWVLGHARARVRDRENLRFERTRAFGRVRRIALELGHRLHAVGALDSPRDVFYLELEELLGFVDGTSSCPDLRGLSRVRKTAFEGFEREPEPAERFWTWGMVPLGQSYASALTQPLDTHGDERKGLGCCPGVVRSVCRVVRDPRGVELPSGCILVAERTDPGWIMLFPAAAGLLVERGSLLSHSAIVARELGIPAVVCVPDLTGWLKDGDIVEFDGSSGIVHRIESGMPCHIEEPHAQ